MTASATGSERAAGGSAPRLAATVLALREQAGAVECFMVRRSAKSPFMPSSLVFPGGRLDEADARGGPLDADEAFETAARRECMEEASLDLDAVPLVWFDTWCTPSVEPRRYFTRFFLAVLPAGADALACADEHETHDGRWASADGHLRAWENGEVDLPPPTLCTLLRLQRGGVAGLIELAREDLRAAILPKVVAHEGGVHILMPHDPDYGSAPGEAGDVPPRVHALPHRFVLERTRWVPR